MITRTNFSWITLGTGLLFSFLLMLASPLNQAATFQLPLLMTLFIAELGFLVSCAGGIAAFLEFRRGNTNRRLLILMAGNSIIAINLLYSGYMLWPEKGF